MSATPYNNKLMPPPVMMVVDDEEPILSLAEFALFDSPFELITAPNAMEALARAQVIHVLDVIIADFDMPGMDGITMLRQMRELFPHSIRILHTGHPNLVEEDELKSEGLIHEMAVKPVSLHNVEERIKNLLVVIRKKRRMANQ